MNNGQNTAKGETYVLWENYNRDGDSRPIIVKTGGRRNKRNRRSTSGSNRSRRWPSGNFFRFGGQWVYLPQWFVNLIGIVWDRMKLIGITLIASRIIYAKLPVLLSFLFQP